MSDGITEGEARSSQGSDSQASAPQESDGPRSEDDPHEHMLAEVLGFVLAGRPERVDDGMLALAPAAFRAGVRQAREALATLAVCAAPAEPSIELRARLVSTIARRLPKRALVVIDMIHDHLDPGTLLEVPRAREVVPALKDRLATARAHGVPVVYVVDEHDPDDPDLDAWGTHAVRGTKGTEVWDALAPLPGDRVVKKPSYSAFFESELGHVLDELGVDTLVLAGCLTEIGIVATATDAMQRGFTIEVPPDSQAGSSPEAEAAALGTLRVMAPFGPARRARLERIAQLAA